MSIDSFQSRTTLEVGDQSVEVFALSQVPGAERLPYALKVLLENLLRTEDGANITADHIRALAAWDPAAEPDTEIQFTPARVIMQDFTGVPCVVDLATMREAVRDLGGDPSRINPLAPAELVIDHSVIADVFARAGRLPDQHRHRVRPQPGALPVPAVGADGVRRVQGRAARAPGSSTRSTSSTSPASSWCAVAWPTPTRSSAPTATRRWSTAWGSSAGASAASRPRRRCSASPCRCSSRASSASSSPGSCRRARPPPTSSSRSPSSCASTASSASSSSSTATAWARCRSPTGPRSAT